MWRFSGSCPAQIDDLARRSDTAIAALFSAWRFSGKRDASKERGHRVDKGAFPVLKMPEFHAREKLIAVFLSAFLLVTVALAVFYIAEEADHHCSGDGCPICVCLQQCETIVQTLYGGDEVSSDAGEALLFFIVPALAVPYAGTADTLIVRKVRMNN
jgi:hypothetical protein